MAVNFQILSGITVPENYSWDFGMPYSVNTNNTSAEAFSTNVYISGYSPGVRVQFINTTTDINDLEGTYIWNFGDFYNSVNNVVLVTGTETVEHDYIVPGSYTVSLSCLEGERIRSNIVNVFEIPPLARMHSVIQPVTGVNNLTVQLTPHTIKLGSFSVDQIDWDLGDGTPVTTVTRYTTPDLNKFTYTNIFSADPADPRNYALNHTYIRKFDSYSIFYPSITAYSSNTSTRDACSIPIGPIILEKDPNEKIHLHKIHNDIFCFENQNTASFLSKKIQNKLTTIAPLSPTNLIRNSFNQTLAVYSGNPGSTTYPRQFVQLDPNFELNSLLLHFDGVNNSTTFTDSSINNLQFTSFNGARILTGVKRFGTGSGFFNGINAYIATPDNTSLNFNNIEDFTIEGWIYFSTIKPSAILTKQNGWVLYFDNGILHFGIPFVVNAIIGFWTPQINTWYYWGVTRQNGTLRLFADNTLLATAAGNFSFSSSQELRIGVSHTQVYHHGYIDEIRITKGVARYTTPTFLPPSTPFLDNSTPYF